MAGVKSCAVPEQGNRAEGLEEAGYAGTRSASRRNAKSASRSGTVQPPIPAAGNWMAVPSRRARAPLMPPVEGPGGRPGERTEGGSGECPEGGSGECPEDGPGERTEDGPGDSTPDGPGDGTGDGPRDGTGGHPGYRTPGDPGGVRPVFVHLLDNATVKPVFRADQE
jgi:hypothetical protein